MIILSRRFDFDPLSAIRHQEMTDALEPVFEQMHEIIESAGFASPGKLELSFPGESVDVDTRVTWTRA